MNAGTVFIMAVATAISRDGQHRVVATDGGDYRAKAVIVASGSSLRRLGIPGEEEMYGRGVSQCATCDGPLYTGQVVGVVGGGDSAADEALTLTQYADRVLLFHHQAQLDTQMALQDRLHQSRKIEVVWNSRVEAVLGEDPLVREAVVVKRDDTPHEARLVAYVVPTEGAVPVAELRERLKERMPAYMVPSAFVTLEALPRTATGKLDRLALPEPNAEAVGRHAPVAPRSHVEEAIAGVWRDVLSRERVGVHDDFFELGGSSLTAIEVARGVAVRVGVEVPLMALFEGPTVAELAANADALRRGEARGTSSGEETLREMRSNVATDLPGAWRSGVRPRLQQRLVSEPDPDVRSQAGGHDRPFQHRY